MAKGLHHRLSLFVIVKLSPNSTRCASASPEYRCSGKPSAKIGRGFFLNYCVTVSGDEGVVVGHRWVVRNL